MYNRCVSKRVLAIAKSIADFNIDLRIAEADKLIQG